MDSGPRQHEDDAAWQAALDWVMAQHESPEDASLREALAAWLGESPAHRAAYEEARRVWLLTGFVPPMDTSDDEAGREDTPASPPPSHAGRR
jgi:ferric-dicitrate binding protein FerR (iron transport regulator)